MDLQPSVDLAESAADQHVLPRRAIAVVVVACIFGAVAIGVAVSDVASRPHLSGNDTAILSVLSAVIVASWLSPLIIYRGEYSEAVHLDEAVLVVMALLLPLGWTVLAFAGGTGVAQLIRRRALIKAVFNCGQLSAAVGLAVAVSHALAAPTATLTINDLGAVSVGALVFFLVNSASVAGILTATGTPWREAILDGMVVRVSLVGAGVATGAFIALAVSAYPWSLALAVLLLLILRQVLDAQFHGRHDRARLRGLLEATLQANRNLQPYDVFDAILRSARELLRCPQVSISEDEPGSGELGAHLSFDGGDRWLVASGRSRAEPFDVSDGALLETLAAVGTGALTNAHLYQQVGYQRERLAAITWSLGEGVCALDGAGVVTFCNPAASRLLRWATTPDGTTSISGLGQDTTPTFLSIPAQAAMKSGQIVRDDDASFEDSDGKVVPVAFTASAIIDGGQAVGAVIAFRDLTDRKAFEAELRRTEIDREDLEGLLHQGQRLESLGQLAGGIAHDFNNLLGVISSYATFVGETVSDAAEATGGQDWQTAKQDIQQIEHAVQRAAGLTRQLLVFARREVVQPRVVNLNDLVTGVEQLLSRTLGEHITLLTELAPELSAVIADPGQMEQVLVNLAVNARDAMPRGGTLTIDTANVDIENASADLRTGPAPGRYARLRVGDTGTGIPKEIIGQVFEPFFTTKPKGEGSGLGLATAYGIISQAGGYLRISSEPGVGTTLSAILPVTDQPFPTPARSPQQPPAGAGETVLVVEDEDALREVTRRLLERNGYRVLTAANGPAAIDIAGNHSRRIDVLLTDLIMPDVLGKEVADRVIALRPTVRVLYMSGYARPILAAQGNLDPGVMLLEKPFTESSLLMKLFEVLEHRPITPDQ